MVISNSKTVISKKSGELKAKWGTKSKVGAKSKVGTKS